MPIVKDQLICLRRRDFSESSQVLVLLGNSSGKVSLLAKGSKRRRHGVAGGIDLLDVISCEFRTPADGLGVMRDYAQQRSWPALRRDVRRWYCGLYFAEVLDLGTVELAPVPELFELMLTALDQLSQSPRPGAVLVNFQWRLLGRLGVQPVLDHCVSCGRSVTGNWLHFSASEGGLLCRDCEPAVIDKISVGRAGIELLRAGAVGPVAESSAFELLNYHLRCTLDKNITLAKHCRTIFTAKGGKG